MSSVRVGPRAGRREWIGLAVLALPTLLLSLDMSVLFLAIPHLAADLDPSSTQTLWIMDIYAFMIAGFLITMGTLGDRIGRRRLLLIGAGAFGAASVLAAYSTSATMLIAGRMVLGLAGATLMPSTLALITNMFSDPKQRGVAIAVWMSSFTGGAALGPVVGGMLLQWFWWGSVFLLGVPVMVLLLVSAPLLLPEHRDPDAGHLDLLSAVLSLAAILPFVYGLKELAKAGPATLPFAAIVAAAAIGTGFVRRQMRLEHPLMDLRLFRNRAFSAALGVMMVSTLAVGGVFMLTSQYLQLVTGLSPLEAGLLLVPPSLAMIASTLLAPTLAQRVGRENVIGGGLILAATGFALLTLVDVQSGPALVVVGQSIGMAGVGPGAALLAAIVVGSAPQEKAGAAAALSETSGEFGMAMGVALLGSLATAVYRAVVDVPRAIATDATDALRDSLPMALSAARDLPTTTAHQLVEPGREAFVAGMAVAAGVCAGMAVLFGVLALRLLRPAATDGPGAGGPAELAPLGPPTGSPPSSPSPRPAG